MHVVHKKMYSRISSNSEANASELKIVKIIISEEMFSHCLQKG